MKTCPKCGELNGDDRSDCFKCKATLPNTGKLRKICPKCGAAYTYSPNKEECDNCGTRLQVQSYDSNASTQGYAEWWHYAVAILFPLIGLIMGLVYISRGDDELGRTVIITVIVCFAIQVVLCMLLAACSAGMR